MHLAAAQFAATPFDLTHNLDTAERLVREAAAAGAQVVALPEFFNTGYVYTSRLLAFAEDLDGLTLRVLRQWSAELGVCVAGSLLLRREGRLHNTLVLVQPNGKTACYAKQYPFLWERCYFEPGRAPVVVETEHGRVGLLVCWDIAHAAPWQACAGRVDALVIASAAPRLHRAVLNFPEGRRVYLAQLMPSLLRQRDALDGWYLYDLAAQAAALGVPIAHAALAGRFVSTLPFPRLSVLGAALFNPRYWPWVRQAHLASLRATFYATTAVFDAQGRIASRVETETGLAHAALAPAPGAARVQPAPVPPVPAQLRLLERLFRPLAARAHARLAERH